MKHEKRTKNGGKSQHADSFESFFVVSTLSFFRVHTQRGPRGLQGLLRFHASYHFPLTVPSLCIMASSVPLAKVLLLLSCIFVCHGFNPRLSGSTSRGRGARSARPPPADVCSLWPEQSRTVHVSLWLGSHTSMQTPLMQTVILLLSRACRRLRASTSFWPAQTSRTDVEAGAMPRIMARERKDDAPRHVDGEMD